MSMTKLAMGLVSLGALAMLPSNTAFAQEPARLTWQPLHVGDCEMDDGTLTFYPTGVGVFSSTTLTYHTHSGDVWHISIDVLDQNGQTLFSLGTWDSPRMDDGNPPPRYTFNVPFLFDPSLFSRISQARTHSSC